MSGGSKAGNGAAAAAAAIPAGSRKIVQSLKEIVNCSEAEIYAMLKDCNMDPSEAVHRLITEDTFHEVKSKREKKKETKDTPESRPRGAINNPRSGARGGTDRGGRTSSNQASSNDYGVSHGKPIYKKDNGTNAVPTSFNVGTGITGSNLNRRATSPCEDVPVQNTTQTIGIADGLSLPSQHPSGFQNNWSRNPGQPSMADIVRMGRPQSKFASSQHVASDPLHASHDPLISNMSHHHAKQSPATTAPLESAQEYETSQGPVPRDEEKERELGGTGHYNSHDDWSLVGDASVGSEATHPEISGAYVYADLPVSSSFLADEANLERDPRLDENQAQTGDVNGDSLLTESIGSESVSDGQVDVDNSGDCSHLDDVPLNGMYHSQMHAFEHHEVEDVNEEISSATANLQQLNLQEAEICATSADDNPAVIIPDHLQVTDADCSHLSFGSFGPVSQPTLSGSFPPKPLRSNLEMAPVTEDSPVDELNSRNSEYYDGDQLESAIDENMTSRTSTSTRSYDMHSSSQPEIIRDDALDAAHNVQGNFPSVSDFAYPATTQLTAAYNYPDPNSQMQNLSPLSSLMQTYTNPLPSSLLMPPVQHLREFDLPFAALLASHSMPTKYNAPPSMSEVKPENFSAPQPAQQALPSSSIHNAGGPALPQHLPMHPYSQPSLPLGHFANMISYPFLPPSYTFLPSAAFPQAYTNSSPFHQSPATAMKYSPLPQYKSSISGGSLPQSHALPPGYGGFTSSTNNIPGSFSLNPSTAPASSAIGFDEALSSQYKDGSHYLPLQHNENSAMWLHGAGSRTVSSLPGNTFYGFQGQHNQQNGGFRQAQQQPSQYGQMGYLNMYQTHGGPAQEQHQQNPSEGNLSGSQGPASHQIWQHGY